MKSNRIEKWLAKTRKRCVSGMSLASLPDGLSNDQNGRPSRLQF
ncbi:MAG: hypothetical protein P8N76_21985 [Pirellulaceae bacterium]|nr:hypothetical protein [Pirellulaceae bacterium]